ncbi:hypothetical protein [Sulfurospirillum diekertiae]|uniref:Copper resistance protein D domain-containing protein n=1 Tax=Sulfurospirillum diekertiae TaxID=1854492 RepID=A0A1Y0HMA5_9BACT|nr:hypothetical protein [Sulfurospirillum diekertiae]ARU48504.1 hypothetical protein Sdiek1_1340 [Sulfurospirillum diekertiae]ASC93337.1 hypothetical protein Sdiek2_1318 [Sulfurospirillum diekertiae]
MQAFFEHYKTIIIFLHILSAVVWVGGMIAIKFAVHPVIQTIEEPIIRLGNSLRIVGRLFHLVMPFIALSLICALLIIKGTGYTGELIYLKEAIWTMMTLNYTYMYIKRTLAQKSFDQGNFVNAKEHMRLLPTILLPINIVLGIVAIFLGVMLRG